MRTVATIRIKDEGNALRAAARIKREKPAGAVLVWCGYVGPHHTYELELKADNALEKKVQEYLRGTVRQLAGHETTKFALD
jgi:hypothetical protein